MCARASLMFERVSTCCICRRLHAQTTRTNPKGTSQNLAGARANPCNCERGPGAHNTPTAARTTITVSPRYMPPDPNFEFSSSPKSCLAEMLQGQPGSDAAIRLQSHTAVSEIHVLSSMSKISVGIEEGRHAQRCPQYATNFDRQHLQQADVSCVHLLMRLQPTGSLSLTVGLLCCCGGERRPAQAK
jgi:hypothetical protein